ncbi:MAG: hypothetical protein KGD65_05630 [Candidatus Lokiarchaeota archaeon]|nr:hypothetical protein [Candidatus Lokiarchaeota archaeon]
MEKQTIIKLAIPFIFLASIYSGIFYNFVFWFNSSSFNTYWSFFITSSTFIDTITITFIAFTIVLLVSINMMDKISYKPILIFCFILIGFCCIYISLTIMVEWLFLFYFLMGLSIAYLTPCLIKLTTEKIKTENTKEKFKNSFAIIVLIWLFVSAMLFLGLGTYYPSSSWRLFYLVTGIINIASSPLINFL